MRELRTNTATRITVGPFIDKTDFLTPETAITVTSCKLTLMVDTGGVPTLVLDTAPTASGGNNDMVHVTGDDSGYYDLELTAANVNYLGRACLSINDLAVHLPVFHEFMIISAQEFDRKYGTQGRVQRGTLTGVGAQSATLASQTVVTDFYKGARLEIVDGETGGGQVRYITTHTNADPPVCTLDRAWTTQPTGAQYILTPDSLASTVGEIGTEVLAAADANPIAANVKEVSDDATAPDTLELFAEALDQATGQLDTGSVNGTIPVDVQKINTVDITGDGSATPFGV